MDILGYTVEALIRLSCRALQAIQSGKYLAGEPALASAIEALRRRIIAASNNQNALTALVEALNLRLIVTFGIVKPHTLLVNEAQIVSFIGELDRLDGHTRNGFTHPNDDDDDSDEDP